MNEAARLNALSEATTILLSQGEGSRSEYKRTTESISSEDIVGFANSAEGGVILVGVKEKNENGAQMGEIIGADVSDGAILQLMNKAISCLPPVAVDISIENAASTPIMVVSVPSSETKPHCTPRGVYCRRDGARNRALHPSELLKIFLEAEAEAFTSRFEAAANTISGELDDLERSLGQTIQNMGHQLGWAESNLDDTSSTIDTVLAYVKHLRDEQEDIADRLRTLFRQDTRDDPVRVRFLAKLKDELVDQLSGDAELRKAVVKGDPLSIRLSGKFAKELQVEDGQEALRQAAEVIREREDLKNYKLSTWPDQKREAQIAPDVVAIAATLALSSDASQIDQASAYAVSRYNGEIVALAGIRKPSEALITALADGSVLTRNDTDLIIQLDWFFLSSVHEGKGQMTRVLRKLLQASKKQPFAALVDGTNEAIPQALLNLGFRKIAFGPDKVLPSTSAALYLKLS